MTDKEYIEKLTSEIASLKSTKDIMIADKKLQEDKYNLLLLENKKLNERIKELEQCNLNLQEWLDNKEKVNKSLREELQEWLNAMWNK